MIPPSVSRADDGSVTLENLAPAFVHVLHELPELLGRDQPDAVSDRLYPLPSADDERNDEWRRLVHPDLFALLASAREIVVRDLGGLRPEEPGAANELWRLPIPAAHVPGWISALNAGRLALGALHDIAEGELNEGDLPAEWNERHVAVAKIHLLGWLQQLLLE